MAFMEASFLLWVVGTRDSMHKRGASYAFDKAPANTRNKYG